MAKLFNTLIVSLLISFLFGCEDEKDQELNPENIKGYELQEADQPIESDVELIGDEFLVLEKGQEYIDQGVSCGKYVCEYELLSDVNTSLITDYTLSYNVYYNGDYLTSVNRYLSIKDTTAPVIVSPKETVSSTFMLLSSENIYEYSIDQGATWITNTFPVPGIELELEDGVHQFLVKDSSGNKSELFTVEVGYIFDLSAESLYINENFKKYDIDNDGFLTRSEVMEIKELDFSGKELKPEEVDFLSKLIYLEYLNLSDTGLTSTLPLVDLVNIIYLNVSNNDLEDLWGLRDMNDLKFLDSRDNDYINGTSLSAIKLLPKLETLKLTSPPEGILLEGENLFPELKMLLIEHYKTDDILCFLGSDVSFLGLEQNLYPNQMEEETVSITQLSVFDLRELYLGVSIIDENDIDQFENLTKISVIIDPLIRIGYYEWIQDIEQLSEFTIYQNGYELSNRDKKMNESLSNRGVEITLVTDVLGYR